MMISNITYRLIAFADYSNIRFNNDTAASFSTEFSENNYRFGQIFDPMPAGQLVPGFMLMPNGNGECPIISIFPGKVDIRVGSTKKEGFSSGEQRRFCSVLCEYLDRIYGTFEGKLQDPNRLALITEYVYFEIDREKKALFRDKFIHAPSYYDGKLTDELFVRIFGKEKRIINDIEEDINCVTTIDRWLPGGGIGPTASVDGYRVELDLNTASDNKRNRFSRDSIIEFVDQMQGIKEELFKEIFDGCSF